MPVDKDVVGHLKGDAEMMRSQREKGGTLG